jgi:O-antigen/teichoic acid export membrane protein
MILRKRINFSKDFFKFSHGFVLIRRAMGYLVGERLVRFLIGFLIHPLIVRFLGPEKYGVYGYAISYFAVFQIFVNYGTDDIYLKDLVTKKMRADTILGSAFAYKIFCSFIAYLLMFVILFSFDGVDVAILPFIAILGLYNFFGSFSVFEIFLQAKMDFKTISFARIISYTLATILKIALVIFKIDYLWLAVIFSLENLFLQIIIYIEAKKHINSLDISMSYIKDIVLKTWPLFLTMIVLILNQKMGVFVLNTLDEITQVGQLTVMQTLLKYVDFIPLTVLVIILPKFIESRNRNDSKYQERTTIIYSTMFYLGVANFLLFYLVSGSVVRLLYGNEFSQLSLLLPWGAFCTIVTYVNYFKAKHFVIESMNSDWMYYNLGVFLVMVIIQYPLIDKYGAIGAIVSYALGHFIFDVIFYIFNKRSRAIYHIIFRSIYFPVKFLQRRIFVKDIS